MSCAVVKQLFVVNLSVMNSRWDFVSVEQLFLCCYLHINGFAVEFAAHGASRDCYALSVFWPSVVLSQLVSGFVWKHVYFGLTDDTNDVVI